MDNQEINIKGSLERIVKHADNYPAAQMAAGLLSPLIRQREQELTGNLSHAGPRPHYSHTPPDTLTTVTNTIIQVQAQMFDLRKLAITHPEQKNDIDRQHDEIKDIGITLNQALAMVHGLNEVRGLPGAGRS